MNEEMVFLDDSLQMIEAFFANHVPGKKYFRLESGVQIKQISDFWKIAAFGRDEGGLLKAESDLCRKLYIKGYCTIIDYNEGDFLIFKDEGDLNEWLCQMPYGLLERHEQFIDANGVTKEIVSEVSVRFKRK